MTFHFYSPVHFEKWDWTNSTDANKGIGGSETCHVEMAWRLARRDHEVYSYSPLPRTTKSGAQWRGTTWKRLEDADFTQPGIWVVFRDAECIDKIPKTRDQQAWLVCQDEVPVNLTPERCEKIDKVLAYCQWHQRHMERILPFIRGKVVVTSNGLKSELVREVLADPPPRDPYRIMYASSPDRGLLPLLTIFKRAREFEPRLNLHIFYGLNNIQKLIKFHPRHSHFKTFLAELKPALDQPNVTWHGRVGQKELYREWAKTGIWCYPTTFTETSAIVCMESQALGAVPVFSPRAALAENVRHGYPVEGPPSDPAIAAQFAYHIVQLAWHSILQQSHRDQMMPDILSRFAWDRQVDQWESWVFGFEEDVHVAQFNFQRKYAVGRVLNVGCADDPAGFGRRGALNVDALMTIPWLRDKPTKAHLYCDFRRPLPRTVGTFDSVVLGDILEHMTDQDAVKMLVNAQRVLVEGGKVVVTCPEDRRPVEAQHVGLAPEEQKKLKYPPGTSPFHERPITRKILAEWLAAAGLRRTKYQAIDYGHFPGHGVVAVPARK